MVSGDTLGKIARQNLPAGVTLNQMLIALFRANQEAFIRGNNFSSALNTAVDAIKTLNTAIGVCNTALDAFKASSSVWLSTKVKGQ